MKINDMANGSQGLKALISDAEILTFPFRRGVLPHGQEGSACDVAVVARLEVGTLGAVLRPTRTGPLKEARNGLQGLGDVSHNGLP
jgi:hypothetical protein